MIRAHSASSGGGAGNRSVPQPRQMCSRSASISSSGISRSGVSANSAAPSCVEIHTSSIESLHRLRDSDDGRGGVRVGEGAFPPGDTPGPDAASLPYLAEPSSRFTIRRRLLALWRALEDGWVGDVIGGLSLFALMWLWLVAGWVLS